jgi:hypothetical protein
MPSTATTWSSITTGVAIRDRQVSAPSMPGTISAWVSRTCTCLPSRKAMPVTPDSIGRRMPV